MTSGTSGKMKACRTRRLRDIGLTVSALGAGCWTIGGAATNHGIPIGWDKVDEGRAFEGLMRACALGVTFFDTADAYGHGQSERILGKMFTIVPRHTVVISSKVGYLDEGTAHRYAPEQMRRQLTRTLDNLGTDHLDVYFFHSSDFGADDGYLAPAVEQMRAFAEQGLIGAIGMRAPHTFAVEWANRELGDPSARDAARFLRLFNVIEPDVITVRYNLLSPAYRADETDVFAFAERANVAVIIKQAYAQGLLLGTHRPETPRTFGPGDHRRSDPMFAPSVIRTIWDGLAPLRERYGPAPAALARIALSYALARDPTAPVLVGFRDAEQISTAISCLTAPPLTLEEIDWLHQSLTPVRAALADLRRTPSAIRDSDPRLSATPEQPTKGAGACNTLKSSRNSA